MTFINADHYFSSILSHPKEDAKKETVNQIDASAAAILPLRCWVPPFPSEQKAIDLNQCTITLAAKRWDAAKVTLTMDLRTKKEREETKGDKIIITEAISAFQSHYSGCDIKEYYDYLFNDNLNDSASNFSRLTAEQLAELRTAQDLFLLCNEIKEELETTLPTPEQQQSLRERLNTILNSGIVQNAPSNKPGVPQLQRFLQALSYQINTQSEGMEEIEEIGSKALAEFCQVNDLMDDAKITAKNISDWTATIFLNLKADKWDTPIDYFCWALKNFLRFILAFIDNWITGAHSLYNSYALGNANMWIGDIQIKESAAVHFNLGPSPTTDALFEAQLEWEESQGIKHIQHTLEYNHRRGESARLCKMRDLQKEKKIDLIGTPLDGPIAKGKDTFQNITSVDDFHDKLKDAVKTGSIPDSISEYNGFANSILNDTDINEVIDASKAAFNELIKKDGGHFQSKHQADRLRNAMLLGFTGFLALKTLIKFGENLSREESTATMGQACKQDVDRGPIVNAITIAYMQLIKNDSLNIKDAKQLIGLVVMRALMVDGRQMVKSRLNVFLDFFDLISQNEVAFVNELKKFADKQNDGSSPLVFIPSNSKPT
ncbi:MAG: hypothetical protein JSR93_02350 [Verrucomicrobia bacterium]|nr:hypothetical protein [Verrucomicrobiota bacterium]